MHGYATMQCGIYINKELLLQSKRTSLAIKNKSLFQSKKNKLKVLSPTAWSLIRHLHRNPPEPHQISAPEPSGTLQNLIRHLHWKPLEPHQISAPEPSGTLRNPPEPSGTLLNPPEPHQASAPETSGSTETLRNPRNLTRSLHQNPPEPSGTLSGTWCGSCTGSHQS